jgi:hypothetical protein
MNYANLGACLNIERYAGLDHLGWFLLFGLILVAFSLYLSFRGEA